MHVAAVDTNNDGRFEILTGSGGKFGLRAWSLGTTNIPSLINELFPYDPNFAGGIFVAGAN